MPCNQPKYLVLVQPTLETELSFSIGELEFYNLNFKKKYAPENSEPDEPFESLPVQVQVIYAG